MRVYRPGTKKLTPVMRQYREAKEAFPDAILFFRLGDFYEMFNDDAVIAARVLSLTLTSRNKKSPDPVPMAGIPHHAAHNYLSKLIAAGHKVAICEQIGDPSKIKGIVPRKVVRVISPGLITDSDQLDARQNNFLAAIDHADDRYALALLDLSTGELSACSMDASASLIAELARAEPAEVLVPAALKELETVLRNTVGRSTLRRDDDLAAADVVVHLDEGVSRPLYQDACAEHAQSALQAAARVLRFASRCMPEMTLPVVRLAHHDPEAFMRIDETAQAHLELSRDAEGSRKGSLLAVVDKSITPAGARMLRRQLLAPLLDVAAIRRRHDAVEQFVRHGRARTQLREVLAEVGDIERLTIRATLGEATPRDLASLRDSLAAAPLAHGAIAAIEELKTDGTPLLDLSVDLQPSLAAHLSAGLVDDPPARISDGNLFRAGFDAALDEVAQLRQSGTALLGALETRLREETGIGSLKVKQTRAFGWYIEVTRANVDKVPDSWRRRQTLTNVERYLNDELQELADRVEGAAEQHAELETALFHTLVQEVARHAEGLHALAATLAQWDVSSALAQVAADHGYVRPEVNTSDELLLMDARHPVVERFLPTGQFVPNDTKLQTSGERMWLITGPNMAGKSTLMRQVAHNVILAQAGAFVAAKQASIGLVDRVFSRVGANDNLARGESTFMVEMREAAAILRHATRRSLVILDEIGRGTSTYDGLAIAWAVAEHLHDVVGCRAMFATHYHQLTELADHHRGVANYSVSAREHDGDIVFLHRITKGAVSRSYGIAVARLAGLPESVLGRASAVLQSLESGQALAGGPSPQADRPQLDLFAPATPQPDNEVLTQLRNVDTNRMTPLEALQLLTQLKRRLTPDS